MGYSDREAAAEAILKPLLTDEVLSVMVLAVRTIGNGVDSCESRSFVNECFGIAEKDTPPMPLFDYSKEVHDD